jgi:lactoylglutathione lyase
MRYLHSMIRVFDLDASLNFYVNILGLTIVRRKDSENGRFTLIFLAAQGYKDGDDSPFIELTYNWDEKEAYTDGKNFGHLAFEVENIYQTCQTLLDNGITILRPPRDGRMVFVKCPDGISLELLQKPDENGEYLETCEPWLSMENQGSW